MLILSLLVNWSKSLRSTMTFFKLIYFLLDIINRPDIVRWYFVNSTPHKRRLKRIFIVFCLLRLLFWVSGTCFSLLVCFFVTAIDCLERLVFVPEMTYYVSSGHQFLLIQPHVTVYRASPHQLGGQLVVCENDKRDWTVAQTSIDTLYRNLLSTLPEWSMVGSAEDIELQFFLHDALAELFCRSKFGLCLFV